MSEIIVKFHEHEQIPNKLLKFAVIFMARYKNKWIFCRHKERNTYEIPGGHREPDENIDHTAERELAEETGAVQFSIEPICFYSVTSKAKQHMENYTLLRFMNLIHYRLNRKWLVFIIMTLCRMS